MLLTVSYLSPLIFSAFSILEEVKFHAIHQPKSIPLLRWAKQRGSLLPVDVCSFLIPQDQVNTCKVGVDETRLFIEFR